MYRQNKKQVIGLIAVLTILLNLMLLHFMAWFVVEKPLKRLSLSIDQINKADRIHIPYQHRKDRIGVLAIALKNFQNVLTHLRDEDLRKKNQKEMIQQLIQKMAAMIESIQMKAKAMKKSAIELSTLADNTEDQTKTANESASRTVEQTSAVSYSTQQLQAAVKDISAQISKQNELVGNINEVTRASRDDMEKLTRASEEINEIVSIVKNIAGQTKLLALNARIEAARSGEAGKGFAVVAREVRALSMQTQAANEQIADKIAAIQKAGRTIIEYTQQTDIRIERLTLTSHQISVAVEEQDAFTTGISKNAHATSNDIKDVSVRISKLNDAARVTSRFAGSVQSYSEELETLLSGLLHETHEKLSKAGLTETIGGSNDVINTENQLPSSVVSNQKQTKEGRSAA